MQMTLSLLLTLIKNLIQTVKMSQSPTEVLNTCGFYFHPKDAYGPCVIIFRHTALVPVVYTGLTLK